MIDFYKKYLTDRDSFQLAYWYLSWDLSSWSFVHFAPLKLTIAIECNIVNNWWRHRQHSFVALLELIGLYCYACIDLALLDSMWCSYDETVRYSLHACHFGFAKIHKVQPLTNICLLFTHFRVREGVSATQI